MTVSEQVKKNENLGDFVWENKNKYKFQYTLYPIYE